MNLRAWLLPAMLLGPALAWAEDNVEIKTTPLGHDLFMFEGQGGNIGVSVGEDGVILIDDQYAPMTPKIEAAVKALSDQPIRFVLNTHWHGDHTGGNENLGKGGALIVAHHKVRARLAAGGLMETFKREVPPAPDAALPMVTFGDDISFHVNGLELQALHVAPAHTDGDAIVIFRGANVIHTGDVFFNGLYPAIDWGSGGNIDGMIAASARLLALSDDKTRIIPGHGPLSNRKELAAYRAMLIDVAERTRKLLREGKSLEQVQAAKPSAAYDERWGKGYFPPAAFVEMVVRGLERAPKGP